MGRTLLRDLTAMLMRDGMMLPDRTISVPEHMKPELDVDDVMIGRNDEFSRTICHVHRPSDETYAWRHDIYMVWDDGRTAYFSIDMGLDEDDMAVRNGMDIANGALKAELRQLVIDDITDVPTAGTIHTHVLDEVQWALDEVNEALLLAEETGEGEPAAIVEEIMGRHRAIREAEASLDVPRFETLHRLIGALHDAHHDAILLRLKLNEFYLVLSEREINQAQAGDGTPIPPHETWDLLQLLDKVAEF